MRLTQDHYDRIARFPKHRGSLTYNNLQVLNAILFVAGTGANWRRLPKDFDHWHTIYARMRGWARRGVLAKAFDAMQAMQIVRIRVEVCSLDCTTVKMQPDVTGALKKGPQSIGRSRRELTTKIHMVAANGRTILCFPLSPEEYDRVTYNRRNEVKRIFRRQKSSRRIFSWFGKLDEMFTAFLHFALVADVLIYINKR